MRLRAPMRQRREDNLIPLINIVFLILIFFLIASTIKPFSERKLKLAESATPSTSAASPRMLIIRSDGAQLIGNQVLSETDLQKNLVDWSKQPNLAITIVADRTTKAAQLLATATLARAAGIKNVKLLTRRVR